MATPAPPHDTQPRYRLARSLIAGWALAGGVLLLAVVLVNVFSVLGSALFGRPFPGDFELTEIGVCVAAFAFLPYCQITGSNVSADIFTARASPRVVAWLTASGALIALLFSLLLVWRMWDGMLDQKRYDYTTAILQFPHWLAFLPILVSLALLAVAALISLSDQLAPANDNSTHHG